MTEADLYPHLAHLAGGQVYPYVVPLLDGRPSVALPWVVFSLISSVSADVMGGQAESSVSVQIDVYAETVTQARQIRQDAREAIMLLAPGSVSEMQDYIPENRCTVQPWSFRSRCDFFFFLQNHTPPRAGFLLSGGRMSALYERSQLTQVMISSAPATAETMDKAEYLRLDCTIKEVQFTAGQKQDIDVTTLCSTEQENINGLGASSEISMSGNFYLNQAQNALRDAYDNDALYAFKVLFPSGKGFKFLAEVRQHTWSSGTNGVVAATFSLRMKGKPVSFVVPLAFVKNLDKTLTVNTGALLTMSVSANGGTPPYKYAWKKDGQPVDGQTTDTFSKPGAQSADAGKYTCVVTDSAEKAQSVTSVECTVTVSAAAG